MGTTGDPSTFICGATTEKAFWKSRHKPRALGGGAAGLGSVARLHVCLRKHSEKLADDLAKLPAGSGSRALRVRVLTGGPPCVR